MLHLKIEDLGKSFGRKKVLDSVSIDFEGGKIFSILGPNASGKTTLIKAVLGMVFPDLGRILLNGKDIRGDSEYKRDIGYLPQIAQFPENLRVRELISLVEDIRGKNNHSASLTEMFELTPFLNEKVNVLSGGTKQKVNVVLAFMYDNPVLILDEPTNGLDPVALVKLKQLIHEERRKGKCIIITTHIMQLVEELSDDITYLLEGKIHFSGSPEKLRNEYGNHSVELCISNMIERNKMKTQGSV